MQDHHAGCLPVAGQFGQQFESRNLVIEIEVRQWFVEQVEARRLGQQAGDRQPLPLAAGQRVHVALCEIAKTDGG